MTISFEVVEYYLGLSVTIVASISLIASFWIGTLQGEKLDVYYGRLLLSIGMLLWGLSLVFSETKWLHWLLLLIAVLTMGSSWIFFWKGRKR